MNTNVNPGVNPSSRCSGTIVNAGCRDGGPGGGGQFLVPQYEDAAPRPLIPPASRPLSAAGFSLIEVLVAISMVALALTAGLGASMALTRQAEREPEVLLAQLCAHNTLAALRLARQLPEVGDSRQTCTQAGREFGVRVQAQPTAAPDFRQVNVQVMRVSQSGSAAGGTDAQVLLSLSTVMGRH